MWENNFFGGDDVLREMWRVFFSFSYTNKKLQAGVKVQRVRRRLVKSRIFCFRPRTTYEKAHRPRPLRRDREADLGWIFPF